jgi:hypothetical protein
MLVCRPWKEQQQQVMAQVMDREIERLPVVQDVTKVQLCAVKVQLCAVKARLSHVLGVLNFETSSWQ